MNVDKEYERLKSDCKQCCGLCCVGLFFSKVDGFLDDKEAGTPCQYLKEDFTCNSYTDLLDKGSVGCLRYECFGAGQLVIQKIFFNQTWKNIKYKQDMIDVFVIMEQIHEMIWYLIEMYSHSKSMQKIIEEEILSLQNIALQSIQEIKKTDIQSIRKKVDNLIQESLYAAKITFTSLPCKHHIFGRNDFSGKTFKGEKLRNISFRGAFLIGVDFSNLQLKHVNFLGADMRDAKVYGTDLSSCLFLTQGQINSCWGNQKTILPKHLHIPSHWNKI